MKRKLLSLILHFLLGCTIAQAQFNNEWIDYKKTYYKFKIGRDGLVRIPKSTLEAAGIGSTQAQYFQLWQNGVEQTLFTSVSSGVLPNDGYLEFIGKKNDGKTDLPLYRVASFQLSNKTSLFTDTAAYFLTVNTSTPNKRYTTITNNAAGNAAPLLPYVWYSTRQDFFDRNSGKRYVNRGEGVNYGEYVYSSSFDQGEMLSSDDIYPSQHLNEGAFPQGIFNQLKPYTAGNLAATLRVGWAGSGPNTREISAKINGTELIRKSLSQFKAQTDSNTNIPAGLLNQDKTTLFFTNHSTNPNDRIVVSFAELVYPRLPDAADTTFFPFTLPTFDAPQLLEISNFKHQNLHPVLYNITTGLRMEGRFDNDKVQFLLPTNEVNNQWVLVAQNTSSFVSIPTVTTRNFLDFISTTQQADFIFIGNKRLMGGTGNPLEQYRQYRSSTTGGGFNAKIYDIDEITDQFAFGIKFHPLAIKNFLKYARNRFAITPKYCLLIGKGVTYDEFRANESHPLAEQLQLVPTFGYPASDNLLASDNLVALPATLIGRLSVVSSTEISNYLEKVKAYEAAQVATSYLQDDKAWMKNVVHVVGANDANTELQIRPLMNELTRIAQDTLMGGKVTTFNKFNTTTASTIENMQLANLFEKGFSLLTYFGHSSATALDYNLDDPTQYNNPGKYPMFLLNGCNAGNLFTFETSRLQNISTISEKYVLAKGRGSIGLLASTHFGVVSGLGVYSRGFYRSLSGSSYGQSVGTHIQNAVQYMYQTWGPDYQTRFHTEQETLHGDPSIRINAFPKPDYSIEAKNVSIAPNFLSIAETNFTTNIQYYNLGKATNDSVTVEVKRQYPASALFPSGNTEVVYRQKRKATMAIDSLSLVLPIYPERDKGTNQLIITLDGDNSISEVSEQNNSITKELVIYEDELRPVSPANFAIVNQPNIVLTASTSNPFSPILTYRMEFDTTELFNSLSKVVKSINAKGGIIEFDPGITLQNGTVYYWRLGVVPTNGNAPERWNNASFVYVAGSETGYNQSHYFQHKKSLADRIRLDSNTKKWTFNDRINNLFIVNSIYPSSGTVDNDFSVSLNSNLISTSACVGHSLIFNVFNPLTFAPMRNAPRGSFGSGGINCGTSKKSDYNFEFDDRDTGNRRKIMNFLDNLPNGSYVLVRKILDAPYENETYANVMKADEKYFGTGNTLYHRFKNAGFTEIDSFNRARTFVFLYKKNDNGFSPVYKLSDGLYDRIQLNLNIAASDFQGTVVSPVFGPVKAWKTALWNGLPFDDGKGDRVIMRVIGITTNGQEATLGTALLPKTEIDLSNVDASIYPQIKLRMQNLDSTNATPWSLGYWRVYSDPFPEGALAPNITLSMKDTLEQGEPLNFKIAFKNISQTAFDSLKVKLSITDRNNVTKELIIRQRPLLKGDTIVVSYPIDTKNYIGINTLYVAVNPDGDQNEQYFFNNFLYKTFFVKEDVTNPLLDVTFDGTHILNRDIVSAKPHIQIKLKDENKYTLLSDTAGITIKLKFPSENNPRTYRWGTDSLRLLPPTSGNDNTATIDFLPTLTEDTEGGEYELTVSGKDRNNNRAGYAEYRVLFQVFNKPMISNLLNYPNPFSTSTAFVFTITGTEVPQEFKIQILTITGKIVREITKAELGTLKIGTNITDYKWDGTDQFGAKLANGVYLYHVVSSLDGKAMEKFRLNDGYNQGNLDVTDKYFKKGYGKMVILR